jgi:hypothetical protein
MVPARLAAPLMLGLILVAAPARGFDEVEGARALAMGGALRAMAAGSAGAYLNPAGLPVVKAYVVEGLYENRPQDNTNFVGVSIADSVTSKAGLAAALYYTFMNGEPHINGTTFTRRGHNAGLTLAYPFADRLLLGLNNKYYYADTWVGPQGLAGARSNGYTLDVGALLRVTDSVNLTVVGQNLIDRSSWETPVTLAAGVGVGLSQVVVLDFDAVFRWLQFPARDEEPGRKTIMRAGYHAGGEYFLAQAYPLRLGYSYDIPYHTIANMAYYGATGQGHSYVHGGLGYVTPQFGLELSVRQQVSGPERETLIAFALKLFVQ